MRSPLITGAVCASLLLMACGGGAEPATSTDNSTEAVAAKTDTVFIAKMQYQPANLKVAAGTEVVFMNNDVVAHDATALPDSAWTTGKLNPGESATVTINQGTEYFCSIHQVMKGNIEVE